MKAEIDISGGLLKSEQYEVDALAAADREAALKVVIGSLNEEISSLELQVSLCVCVYMCALCLTLLPLQPY